MNFSHYLPNTEKRIRTLKRVINKRPVAILLPGYSLNELKISELRGLDICYAAINNFRPLEDSILKKISKQFSILMCSANPDLFIDDINYFLKRDNNIFISEKPNFKYAGGANLVNLWNDYNGKLLFFASIGTWDDRPNAEYPLHFLAQNSLSTLIFFCMIGEAKKIILFGADGGRVSPDGLYYKGMGDGIHPDGLEAAVSLKRDSGWFNQTMPAYLEGIEKLFNVKTEILNCSEKSLLSVFPKISYDNVVKCIRG